MDLKYMESTLYLYRLRGRTVHVETRVEDKPIWFTYDGKKHHRKFL